MRCLSSISPTSALRALVTEICQKQQLTDCCASHRGWAWPGTLASGLSPPLMLNPGLANLWLRNAGERFRTNSVSYCRASLGRPNRAASWLQVSGCLRRKQRPAGSLELRQWGMTVKASLYLARRRRASWSTRSEVSQAAAWALGSLVLCPRTAAKCSLAIVKL